MPPLVRTEPTKSGADTDLRDVAGAQAILLQSRLLYHALKRWDQFSAASGLDHLKAIRFWLIPMGLASQLLIQSLFNAAASNLRSGTTSRLCRESPMERREFLKISAMIGLATPVLGCARPAINSRDEHVLIIGAGAAGLTAAAELDRAGVSFELVEASEKIGGRLRTNQTFAEFPISLGAEWIHDVRHPRGPVVLNNISGRSDASTVAKPWRPTTGARWDGTTYTPDDDVAGEWTGDWRFSNTTWLDFFDTLIADGVRERIRLGIPITTVDTTRRRVVCTTKTGQQIHADRVIVTVPLRPLIDGDVRFLPDLPAKKRAAFR
ncbi:MAG: FAD-dependent oxidoreductase, partial [Planctomycetota bacterium]